MHKIVCLLIIKSSRPHPYLHSFPTRRSSDLAPCGTANSRSAWPQLPIAAGFRSRRMAPTRPTARSEEHTSELQSRRELVCRLLLEKKKSKRDCWHSVSDFTPEY